MPSRLSWATTYGQQAPVMNCEDWHSQRFFATATAEDVSACLAAGADVVERKEGRTALHFAAWNSKDPLVIDALVAAGSELEARTYYSYTPLHLAVMNSGLAAIDALLEAGAELEAPVPGDGYTPLHLAARYNADANAFEVLVAAGAKLEEHETFDGFTPLHLAAAGNNPRVVTVILGAGADIDQANQWGHTPLLRAAAFNEPPVIATLLAAGADINARDDNGWTVLHWAAALNRLGALETLLSAGGNVNARTGDGRTLLHTAVANEESPAIIEVLLTAGLDLEARDDDGDTPLHAAALFFDPHPLGTEKSHAGDAIEALLNAGANPLVQNAAGRTALAVAQRNDASLRESAGYQRLVDGSRE